MAWIGALVSAGAGIVGSSLGGGGGPTSTSSADLPSWLTGPSSDIASRIAELTKTQQPYSGNRVADLSPDELMAMLMAHQNPEAGDIEQARGALAGIPRSFSGADLSGYMNPYIQGALNPAARDITLAHSKALADIQRKAPMRSAFGGSREALLEGSANKNYQQVMSDLFSKGYSDAFESGANRFEADRSAGRALSGSYLDLARASQGQRESQISGLLGSGALDRSVRQAKLDQMYSQYQEPTKRLSSLADVLAKLRGGQTTTSTGPAPDPLSQGLGLALGTYGFGKNVGWWGGK